MKIKIIIICFLLLASGLFQSATAQRKHRKQQPAQITLASRIVGTEGLPVVGALIYTNEGKTVSRSDRSGAFAVKAEPQETVLIEADGYEPMTISAADVNKGPVTLTASAYQSGTGRCSRPAVRVPQTPQRRRRRGSGECRQAPRHLLRRRLAELSPDLRNRYFRRRQHPLCG